MRGRRTKYKFAPDSRSSLSQHNKSRLRFSGSDTITLSAFQLRFLDFHPMQARDESRSLLFIPCSKFRTWVERRWLIIGAGFENCGSTSHFLSSILQQLVSITQCVVLYWRKSLWKSYFSPILVEVCFFFFFSLFLKKHEKLVWFRLKGKSWGLRLWCR